VSVHPQHEFCPLCGTRLGAPTRSATSYPRYAMAQRDTEFVLKRVLLFLGIATSAISIFVNAFTYDQAPSLWSIVVVLSFAFLGSVSGIVRNRRANLGRKIINLYVVVAVFLVAIDVFGGFRQWSTTYLIPFMTIFVALLFTILAACGDKHLNEYLGNLLAIFFISLCPVVIYLFSLSARGWSSAVAILYCLLTIVGLVLFMGRDFREEIKKRFHY
jgi:hypothetical protein